MYSRNWLVSSFSNIFDRTGKRLIDLRSENEVGSGFFVRIRNPIEPVCV